MADAIRNEAVLRGEIVNLKRRLYALERVVASLAGRLLGRGVDFEGLPFDSVEQAVVKATDEMRQLIDAASGPLPELEGAARDEAIEQAKAAWKAPEREAPADDVEKTPVNGSTELVGDGEGEPLPELATPEPGKGKAGKGG